EGAAAVDQGDEVLRIFRNRLLEEPQRIIKSVELPQRTRLPQLRQVRAQAGNDGGRPTPPMGRPIPSQPGGASLLTHAPLIADQRLLVESQIGLRTRTHSLELPGMIYWFTGQPGSGKSTLALALQAVLRKSGHAVVHLDSEALPDITGTCGCTEAARPRHSA